MRVRCVIIVAAVLALICFASTAALALTVVPDFPDWWKTGGEPDGVTRIQAHFFHSDPNILPSPDWVYDGFQPAVQDSWNTSIVTAFDVDLPCGSSPFVGETDGVHGDIWAKGAIIGEPGQMSKLMGNLFMPDWLKEFYVEIIWYGGNRDDVTIGVQAEGTIDITGQSVYDDIDDNCWHLTTLSGTIWPQPDSEIFTFDFANSGIFVDSVYIGTHCVPEPSSILAVLSGLIGIVGIARKRK